MLTKDEKDIGKIINCTRKLETLLVSIGATGTGLHTKLDSVQHKLQKTTVNKLRYLASIRNKTMHQDNFKVKDIDDFLSTCNQVSETLKGYIKKSQSTKSKKKEPTKAPQSHKPKNVNDSTGTQRSQKKIKSTKRKSKNKNKKSKKAPESHNSNDEDGSFFGAILIILILVIAAWFLFGGADASEIQSDIESKQNKIGTLRNSKNALNVKIKKINSELATEVRNQGLFLSIFNDTEKVDNLENYQDEIRENMAQIDKDIEVLNDEISELRIELSKIQ